MWKLFEHTVLSSIPDKCFAFPYIRINFLYRSVADSLVILCEATNLFTIWFASIIPQDGHNIYNISVLIIIPILSFEFKLLIKPWLVGRNKCLHIFLHYFFMLKIRLYNLGYFITENVPWKIFPALPQGMYHRLAMVALLVSVN